MRTPFLAACLTLAASTAAFAHAHLQSASPGVGATVSTAPSEVAIAFSEGVEPRFSTIAVRDAQGGRVDAGSVHVAPGDATHLIAPLKAIKPGTYKVEWHATSVDTHKTEGTFSFTVAP